MKKKVVVGMSGGVDSSVAAYLLKEQGYEVIGVTMQIWQDNDDEAYSNDGGCCGLSAVSDARRVSDILDIPYYVMNFKNDFKKNVIDYFVDEYSKGRTPNPCIACNRYVKWESMLHKAISIGADFIATGHYARIVKHPETGRFTIKTSVTSEKDQTYALYNLTQFQLEKTLMPVGDYTKDEIRQIAQKIGLSVANKPDSQEICFIPDNDYGKFIKGYSNKEFKKGNFVDINGKVIGEHRGVVYYTVGQRKGLGGTFGKPMFVKKIDMETNDIVLADDKQVFDSVLEAEQVNYMAIDKISKPIKAIAKIRYSHKPAECTIEISQDNKMILKFNEPQRAITPGQAVVAYNEGYILCGGVIR